MSPKQFWRTRPIILNTLSAVHVDVNNPNPKPKVEEFVDNVPFTI